MFPQLCTIFSTIPFNKLSVTTANAVNGKTILLVIRLAFEKAKFTTKEKILISGKNFMTNKQKLFQNWWWKSFPIQYLAVAGIPFCFDSYVDFRLLESNLQLTENNQNQLSFRRIQQIMMIDGQKFQNKTKTKTQICWTGYTGDI